MNAWDISFSMRDAMLDFAFISTLLIVGFLGRRYLSVFQRYLIPSPLIAGFLGLLLGPELIDLLQFETNRMGIYTYHLLAFAFIALGLQGTGEKGSRGALHVGFLFITSYLVQIIAGVGVALIVVATLMPDLTPAIGMLLPLGFGMGPGIAFAVGNSWEVYGFEGGGAVGLTISAIGFLVAYLSGIAMVNKGVREGKSRLVGREIHLDKAMLQGVLADDSLPEAGRLRLHGGTIEPMSFQLGLVGLLYLITYLVTSGLASIMAAGGLVKEIETLWSFHFLIAFLLAVLVRKVMEQLQGHHLIDTGLSHRLVGLFTDYLIAAAIMGISLSIAWKYAVPVGIMCALGALVTFLAIRYLVPRVFDDHPFERLLGVYGEMTGTISSGLALVRVTDPELTTPVARDLGLGSGMALLFGFPLLAIINMPYTQFEGAMTGYWVVLGICAAYLVLIFIIWKRFGLNFHKKEIV